MRASSRSARPRAPDCWRSPPASPCSIAAIKSASAYGLVKNSSAPALMARTDVGMSPWPVRKMIDVRAPEFASRCCRSRPLRPGSCTSKIRQLGTSAQRLARNAWADAKVSTFHPADRTSLPTASRTDASSSTTYMGAGVVIGAPPRPHLWQRRPARRLPSFRAQGRVDGLQHFFFSERFEQVIHRSGRKRPRAHLFVRSVRCDEDHGQITIARRQLTLKLEPIHSRHADVEYQAVGLTAMAGAQELFGRSEHLHAEPDGSNQPRERFTDRVIVVNNGN